LCRACEVDWLTMGGAGKEVVTIKNLHPRLRVLCLDFNLSYVNPTRNLFGSVLKHAFDVRFFGPGYVSTDVLKRGVDQFVESNGPFDFIVASEHIAFSREWRREAIPPGYKNNYVTHFDHGDLCHVNDIRLSFMKIKASKCVTLLESDFYNFPADQVRVFEDINAYLVGLGTQFVRPIKELPLLKHELFAPSANDNWFDFIEQGNCRVISFPAFVSDTEFSWSPIAARRVRWSIVGVRYWARRQAQKSLSAFGIRWIGRGLSYVLSALERLRLRPLGNAVGQRAFRYLFRSSIEASKYSYTCGSGLGYPIRKFFEIPACGSILVCMPCNGFEALGFQDKTNALICLPQDLVEIHHALERDPDWAQSLADAGRQLVWDKHRISARAIQLDESFRSILARRFAGSYWDSGDYCIVEQDGPEQTVRRIQV